MSFNSYGQMTGDYKAWDHLGNVIPVVESSEGDRPGAFKVAPYLPLEFYDKYMEDWIVIMPGKGVSLDNDGNLVPAGWALPAHSIVYSQTDVDNGVIDVTTGVALTATKTVAVSGVTTYMGRSATALHVSQFIGIAPYAILQWAGDGSAYDDGFNPLGLRKTNYQRQGKVSVNCDYCLELPLVPTGVVSTERMTFSSPTSNISTGTAVTYKPVAKNTVRTPITFSGGSAATLFLVEKDAAADVKVSGDWHIDLTTGVVTVYAAAQPTTIDVDYYYYVGTVSSISKFACAYGNFQPGDFVKFDTYSNYIVAAPPSDSATTLSGATSDFFDKICGQILEVQTYPKSALDKVKTAYSSISTSATGSLPGYTGQMDQMPGSATGGVSDKIHYAGGANKIVKINLISR